jgi:hypothetical protein
MKKYYFFLLILITSFSDNTAFGQYCSAGSGTCDEYISNVVCGSINNNSGACTAGGYANYTAQSTTIQIGNSQTITVTNGYPYSSDQCGIWVDWNNDLDFSDIGETMTVSGNPGNGPYTATISPPSNAYVGSVRMRIRVCYTGTVDPCGNATYGEVEDYTINVTAAAVGQVTLLSENWTAPAGWTYGSGGAQPNNKWVVTSCYNSINGNTLTVLEGSDNSPYYKCTGYNKTTTCSGIVAYKTVNATGYNNQNISFNWMCTGETNYDWGNLVYSIDGGASWVAIGSNYLGQATAVAANNISIPAACDNRSYLIGFKWVNDASGGSDPSFSIDDIILNGTISVPAAAGTIVGSANACAGQTGVSYYVPPISNATGYAWTLPAGATIASGLNTNSITVNFGSTSGNVSVHGTNSNGNGAESPLFPVTVTSIPSAAGIISGTSPLCQGASASFSVAAISGATSYSWNLPVGFNITNGGNSNNVTINVSSASSGIITVAGTNTCGTGTVSANYTISVNPLPSAAGVITGSSTVCSGTSIAYSIGAISNATSYSWSYSGTGVTFTPNNTVSNPTINFASNATAGNLTVNGVNACGGGASSTVFITVNSSPSAAGTITGPSSVCQNSTGNIFSVPAIAGATGYTWNLPAGFSITSGNNTNSISLSCAVGASSGNINVAGTNSCGSGTVSANFPVTAIGVIGNAGAISGSSTVCQSTSGIYSVGAIANASSYVWSYSGSGATFSPSNTVINPTVSFDATATSGNLTVYGINSCGAGGVSPIYPITVNQTSIAASSASAYPNTISAGMSTMLVVNGGNLGTGASWKWYTGSCGGTLVGTGATINDSPLATTTYYVRAEGGSCGTTSCVSVTVTVSAVPVYFGIFNCGANIHIFPSTFMYIDGNGLGDYSCSSACGPVGLVNIDGTMIIEGDWYNNNTSPNNALENISTNNGYVEFRGSTNMQTIGGSTVTTFEHVKINNSTPNSGDNVNLNTNANINATLDLSDGVVKTGANYLVVLNTAAGAVFNHSGTSFIDGNLRRYMASGSGTYAFPLGYGGHTPTNYYLADLENATLTWTVGSYIDSKVTTLTNHTDPDLITANVTELGTQYKSMATQAMWTLTPSVQPTAGLYNMKCWITNIKTVNSLADNSFAILKRANGTNGLAWNKGGGTLNPNGGLGRMLSNDYALRLGLSSFSEFGIAKTEGPLPVELINFNAVCNEDKVNLNWTTASEVNNDFFTIEKSLNTQDWDFVLNVSGAGNSNKVINYSATDDFPYSSSINNSEISYYRLKQTDYDGKFEYSPVTTVKCEDNAEVEIIALYQNNNDLYVEINSISDESFDFVLYDDRVRVMFAKHENAMKGFNKFSYDVSDFSGGIYMLVIQSPKQRITKKTILK